jgi:predicted alpha/beta-hydrolase family hydrolase
MNWPPAKACAAVCAWAIPFHPPGKPLQLRTAHLAALQTPTLILQGERDSFGRREEVETYRLSPKVQLGWIPSGDHSFKPTRSLGLSEEENWATTVALSDAFLYGLLDCGVLSDRPITTTWR